MNNFRPKKIVPVYGTFRNGLPYVRFGTGMKTMFVLAGGPGNSLPRGAGLKMMIKPFMSFLDSYSLYYVTRKHGLPAGFTTREMADDIAAAIKDEFDGPVDAVIGVSFGGMIVQYLAANHSDTVSRVVIALAAYRMSREGVEIDMEYARLVSKGEDRAAASRIMDAVAKKGLARRFMKSVVWLMGGGMGKGAHETMRNDVLAEAEAELNHDSAKALGRIRIPVLIICGGEDIYFPIKYIEETASRIGTATVRVYEGKGHLSAMTDRRFTGDIRAFIEEDI